MMGGGMSGGSHNSGSVDIDKMDMGGSENSNMDEMNMSENSKSYIIAKRYCSQCHEMKNKELHSSEEWKPTLRRMMNYIDNQAKLKPDDYEKVMIEHYYGIDS